MEAINFELSSIALLSLIVLESDHLRVKEQLSVLEKSPSVLEKTPDPLKVKELGRVELATILLLWVIVLDLDTAGVTL
jgi:hypothetical protein